MRRRKSSVGSSNGTITSNRVTKVFSAPLNTIQSRFRPPSNTTSKIGSVFINPGGPGSAASSLVSLIAISAFPGQTPQLRPAFDIIGLDPRGTGMSHQAVSLFPQTEEEYAALAEKNKRLGESCRELTGPLLEHVDTISAAKDHEAVRVALGNEPINFYISLFPDNVRTLVLDAISQHSQSEAADIFIGASSYELVLQHFFAWAATDAKSPLHGQDVKALWLDLLASAKETPIPALSCDGINCRAAGHLNFPGAGIGLGASWELLASALFNASRGDATALSTSSAGPDVFPRLAIQCLDWDRSDSLAEVKAKMEMANAYFGLNHGANHRWAAQHACIGWPVPVKNPPQKLDVKSDTTVLMVTSTGDASTGIPWAVVRQGDGHGNLPLGGEAGDIIVEYLITGKAPAQRFLTTKS
ncbi:hypothetical protein J3E74DRAFT_462115 [Bipolaris maydis]|nr:hypothetical protein J3E74DRAFT_462115 [Bipolaris maydis]